MLLITGFNEVSIHAPHVGRDTSSAYCNTCWRCFNPRAPRGARHSEGADQLAGTGFQSTRLTWGATGAALRQHVNVDVSIHAPHVGRDFVFALGRWLVESFQSTRPTWGATSAAPTGLSRT